MKIEQIKTQKNIDLSTHLTLHIQTQADEFISVSSKKELIDAVKYAMVKNIPYFIMGGGTNIAFKQSKFSGLVIKNCYILLKIIKETSREIHLQVSSGYPMPLLVSETVEKGWGGFEYQKGLPGTVGGAIYMNSKWTRPVSCVSDCLIEAVLIDSKGVEKKVNKDYFNFSYGYSSLQENNEIFLEGIFRLQKTDPALLYERARQSLLYRKQTQPFGVSTCGCYFKNISDDEKFNAKLKTNSAGYLIDKCGLKGFSIGNFQVSKIHANFIINTKNAKSESKDLLQLVSLIKQRVNDKFGIELKEEVSYFS